MAAGITRFFTTTITVETFTGTDGDGIDQFNPPVTVKGMVQYRRLLTRTDSGDQVTSSSQVYTGLDSVNLFTPDSRISVGDDTLPRVISVERNEVPGTRLPGHLVVVLG